MKIDCIWKWQAKYPIPNQPSHLVEQVSSKQDRAISVKQSMPVFMPFRTLFGLHPNPITGWEDQKGPIMALNDQKTEWNKT